MHAGMHACVRAINSSLTRHLVRHNANACCRHATTLLNAHAWNHAVAWITVALGQGCDSRSMLTRLHPCVPCRQLSTREDKPTQTAMKSLLDMQVGSFHQAADPATTWTLSDATSWCSTCTSLLSSSTRRHSGSSRLDTCMLGRLLFAAPED